MRSTSIGTLPADCAASVWKSTPRLRASCPISPMGAIVPISLLACMMLISTVRSVIALRTSSISTRPCLSTGR